MASAQAELVDAEQSLQEASEALTSTTNAAEAMAAYTDALARFEALGGYEREHRAAAILQGLGGAKDGGVLLHRALHGKAELGGWSFSLGGAAHHS